MRLLLLISLFFIGKGMDAPPKPSKATHSLTVKVHNLRNSEERIRYNIYNREDVFPDEDFERICDKGYGPIGRKNASFTFKGLAERRYAVNILHDENKNDRIDKGYFLPVEGIGFSNYDSFGLMNRPAFNKASFYLNSDTTIRVKTIYL